MRYFLAGIFIDYVTGASLFVSLDLGRRLVRLKTSLFPISKPSSPNTLWFPAAAKCSKNFFENGRNQFDILRFEFPGDALSGH